ncbi:hypothetical protein C457_17297 [Haloferax prahovense DSM 18310]|uniref:Uncharacterized protein n=1 Tax=Haloferax prahovense (strain DSM 18310 / JCM 13924 / TL6) TaxID=1227461 RepID=M0G161_HALPT|nr:hypothetical protein C457_17297 [Haloferax prahovense DSM 18310]
MSIYPKVSGGVADRGNATESATAATRDLLLGRRIR